MTTVVCPSCGSGNRDVNTVCWLCQYPLADGAAPRPSTQVTAEPAAAGLGWALGFIVAVFMLVCIGVEIVLLWPGLVIPYALLIVPVIVLMARIVWVQRLDFWRSRTSAPPSAAPAGAGPELDARGDIKKSRQGAKDEDVVGTVVTAVAIGVASMAAAVGLLILLAAAGFVLLLAICFAILATGGGY